MNRVDEIILFHRLSRDHMTEIVEIQLGHLQKLLEDRKIRLDLTPEAKKLLGDKGYDPVYGARPLKRVIQKELQDTLAEKILSGEITEGTRIQIDAGKGGIIFRSLKAAKKAS